MIAWTIDQILVRVYSHSAMARTGIPGYSRRFRPVMSLHVCLHSQPVILAVIWWCGVNRRHVVKRKSLLMSLRRKRCTVIVSARMRIDGDPLMRLCRRVSPVVDPMFRVQRLLIAASIEKGRPLT
jgi:hypothetical protein